MIANQQILAILRRSLRRGQTVDVEGLGAFRYTARRGYSFIPEARPRVFVAYVREDLELARRLSRDLQAAGCASWLDRDQLLPGQNWPRAIERAIEISDIFVACFSTRAIAKRGQFQRELRLALETARKRPLDGAFLVPVRLEPCAIPPSISASVQYIDLFPHWNRSIRKIVRVARQADIVSHSSLRLEGPTCGKNGP